MVTRLVHRWETVTLTVRYMGFCQHVFAIEHFWAVGVAMELWLRCRAGFHTWTKYVSKQIKFLHTQNSPMTKHSDRIRQKLVDLATQLISSALGLVLTEYTSTLSVEGVAWQATRMMISGISEPPRGLGFRFPDQICHSQFGASGKDQTQAILEFYRRALLSSRSYGVIPEIPIPMVHNG